MRQRQPVPIMSLRRYMRTWDDHYRNLTQLERALNVNDANYRNVRRAVANYVKLNSKERNDTNKKLNQMLQSKLPNTDIQRKFKEIL